MAHSLEIRKKALAYLEKCGNIYKVMEAYNVSRNTIYLWKKLQEKTGSLKKLSPERKSRKIDRDKLIELLYLSEIANYFNCSISGAHFALKSIGLRIKKDNNLSRTRPQKSRSFFKIQLADFKELKKIYIDETGVSNAIYREYGWALKG